MERRLVEKPFLVHNHALLRIFAPRFYRPKFFDVLLEFGRDLFLIDGDALFRYTQDQSLDWASGGGQLLHMIFLVERLLQQISVRGWCLRTS